MKNNFKNEVNSQSSLTINKNIALFLYEKVKNGDLDPKYVGKAIVIYPPHNIIITHI